MFELSYERICSFQYALSWIEADQQFFFQFLGPVALASVNTTSHKHIQYNYNLYGNSYWRTHPSLHN